MAGIAAHSDIGQQAAGLEPLWGETLVRVTDTLTWQRPLYSLAVFICCNFLFWFIAFTPWRIYHLLSLISIGLVMIQITKHFLLSRSRGAQVWRGIVKSSELQIPQMSAISLGLQLCITAIAVLLITWVQ